MAKWHNTPGSWGMLSIALHWLVATTVIALFALGLWMTSLDYYDPWYRQGPDIHRSLGILLLFVILLRLGWRYKEIIPDPHPNHKKWEIKSAHIAHLLLYLIPVLVIISGYLTSTADGRAVSVFGWFEIPATFTDLEKQEELMGEIHELLAWGLIVIAAIHAAGALKHHLIDKDSTLTRMFGITPREEKIG